MISLCHTVTFGVLFDDGSSGCVAPSPCTCKDDSINCNNVKLSYVPAFFKNRQQESLFINLAFNHISAVQANAFKNLETINASRIYMYLSYNQIAQIDPQAFNGIDRAVEYLRLEFNNLTSLPVALGYLTNLKTLDITHNPITVLDHSVMSKIGRSLETFELSVHNITNLSYDMRSFNSLRSLTLESIPFSRYNNFVAFSGLESLLSMIATHNLNLTTISVKLQNK